MSKYFVMIEEHAEDFREEIEASSPYEAAEKFANMVEMDIEDEDIIIVAEKIHKFKASTKTVVKPIPIPKNKSKPIA